MRSWAALLLALLFAAQTPAPQGQPPTFRAGTNLVRVDITVTGRNGAPVTDLTSKDFTIEEDGVQQSVEAFRFVSANGQPTDDLSLPIRSPEHARAEAARDDVRVFVIFWDEYHMDQLEGAIRGRAALGTLVRTAFGPTDLVAITDQLTPSDAIRFTRNRDDLVEQVAKLRGRRGVYFPPRSELEEGQLLESAGSSRCARRCQRRRSTRRSSSSARSRKGASRCCSSAKASAR